MTEHNETVDQEMAHRSRRSIARYYGEGSRPGRTLAQKLAAPRSQDHILEMMNSSGTACYGTATISAAILEYYTRLYGNKDTVTQDHIFSYLDDVALGWLSPGHREYLTQPFDEEDVKLAIQSLPTGKAAGLDGLPSEFYKTYADALVPRLLEVYAEAYDRGQLPPMLREALLVMLLKPDKEPNCCDSYRPLSMINIDTKILAKMIALRVQPLLSFLTLPGQSGFVPARSTTHNLRTLLATLHYFDADFQPAAVLLDATKAFDSLSWEYMFAVLQRMGFPPFFLRWIQILYTKPEARVRVNGWISSGSPIARGTRQGCPLSPMLFALALEPLACKLRQLRAHTALNFSQRPLVVSLYADDMLLYVWDPAANLPRLLREYVKFEGISGLGINWTKSTVLPLTAGMTEVDTEFPLGWASDPVKYLGVWVHRDPVHVITMNYGRVITQITDKAERWSRLPLSLADRIAVIKMTFLPKLLYLFVNVPLRLNLTVFKTLQAALLSFVWGGKKARCSWDTLVHLNVEDSKCQTFGYTICVPKHISRTIGSTPQKFLPHTAVEADAMLTLPPEAIALSGGSGGPRTEINPAQRTAWAWKMLARHARLPYLYAPRLPLAAHPNISASQERIALTTMQAAGINTLGDLYQHCKFRPLADIQQGRAQSVLLCFTYVRFRQAIRDIYPDYPTEPQTLWALQAVLTSEDRRGLITRVYQAFLGEHESETHPSYARWSVALDAEMPADHWRYCCRLTGRLTANYNLRIIHFKFLHQMYYTPTQLCKYGLRETACCTRCGQNDADFLHLAWSCAEIAAFWSGVARVLSDVVLEPVRCTPEVCLLGYVQALKPCNRKLVAVATLLAKRAVAQRWGAKCVPTIRQWLRDLTYCRVQLETYAEELPEASKPKDFWGPLTLYLLQNPSLQDGPVLSTPGHSI